MNLNKRQQILAILAIAVVALFAADKLVFTPLTNSWTARSARITKLKQEVRAGTDTLKREVPWREQWDRMRTNTLSSAKPEAESQMLKAFERWSKEAGVSVSSSPQSPCGVQPGAVLRGYPARSCRVSIHQNTSSSAPERDRA